MFGVLSFTSMTKERRVFEFIIKTNFNPNVYQSLQKYWNNNKCFMLEKR